MAGVRDLQRLVLDRLSELDLNYHQASQRTHGKLKHQTLSAIGRGEHSGRIKDNTAELLALALDVPVSTVRRAAHMSQTQPPTEFTLPAKANRLSPKQRKAILAIIDGFLAEQEQREA